MVDGVRALPIRPGSTNTRRPKARATWRYVFRDFLPRRLAEVETRAQPATWHRRTASGWASTRTAMLSWAPRSQDGVVRLAGISQVWGPGQVAAAFSQSDAGKRATYGLSCFCRLPITIRPFVRVRPLSRNR